MKCPLCNEELDVYDVDRAFYGHIDKYADCNHCHHTFIFIIRYNKLFKYHVWDLYFDEKDKQWYSKEDSMKTKYLIEPKELMKKK